MPRNSLDIYRITHIDNIQLLIETGCLIAPNFVPEKYKGRYRNIFNREIQDNRGNMVVPREPNVSIHDLVPFYFCTRSPMLYSVTHSQTATNADIVYLVANAAEVAAAGCKYYLTDCNACLNFALWYYNIDDADKLDWNAINQRYWGRNDDPSEYIKQHKMAEFLVYRTLPWKFIRFIAVFSQAVSDKLTSNMNKYPHELCKEIQIKPDWYY